MTLEKKKAFIFSRLDLFMENGKNYATSARNKSLTLRGESQDHCIAWAFMWVYESVNGSINYTGWHMVNGRIA